ncbi:MAG: mechanosensitive ion channel family protein [Spirochaetales bacterium]|nr:mechanosensitive ion channel family protein [Spirochaetales bacterium]
MRPVKHVLILSIIFIFLFTATVWSEQESPESEETAERPPDTFSLSGAAVLSWLPPDVQEVLKWDDLGYPLWRIISVVFIFILGFIFNRFVGFFIKKYSKKITAKRAKGKFSFFTSTVRAMRRPLRILVWAGIIRIAGFVLIQEHAPGAVWISNIIINVAVVVFIYDFVEVLECIVLRRVKKSKSKMDDMLVPILKTSLRIVVVGLAAIQLFQSISGQSITTILAGLGLGGLAVALAAQDTIKNFFGFLMIVLDKPFQIGDRIDFDGHDGVVEKVGLRSTKMRRLDGHVVTIPNMLAADKAIHNIGGRVHIRRIMNIGITYDTPPKKVEQAIAIVKEILNDHEGMNKDWPPYVFFKDFTDSSLNIFAIYWYHPPAYWDYMKHAEYVNLEILKRFNKAGIDFAFPTQTVELAPDDNLEAFLATLSQKK